MRPFTQNDPWPLAARRSRPCSSSASPRSCSPRGATSAPACSPRATSSPLRPFGLGSPLGLATRLELPVLAAWCAGAARGRVRVRHHRQGDDRRGAGVAQRHARQVRRAGQLREPVLRRRVPARRHRGRAAPRRPDRRGVRRGDVGPAACTCSPSRPAAPRCSAAGSCSCGAGIVVGGSARRGSRRGSARATQGVDLRLGTMVGAGLNVVPTALVALGIGAVVLAVRTAAAAAAGVRRRRSGRCVVDLLGLDGLGPRAGSSTSRCSTTWRWRRPRTPTREPSRSRSSWRSRSARWRRCSSVVATCSPLSERRERAGVLEGANGAGLPGRGRRVAAGLSGWAKALWRGDFRPYAVIGPRPKLDT